MEKRIEGSKRGANAAGSQPDEPRVVRLVDVPGTDAGRARARAQLARLGLAVLGSRGSADAGTQMFVAGTALQLNHLVARLGRPAKGQRTLRAVSVPRVVDVLREPGPGRPLVGGVWSVTLHPDPDLSAPGRAPVAAGPALLARFTAAVEAVGGKVPRPGRSSGSLTYLAIVLPDVAAARELALFSGLRGLQPMPMISLR